MPPGRDGVITTTAVFEMVHPETGVVVVHALHPPVGEVITLVRRWSPVDGSFTVAL